jgi:hypothetical protein
VDHKFRFISPGYGIASTSAATNESETDMSNQLPSLLSGLTSTESQLAQDFEASPTGRLLRFENISKLRDLGGDFPNSTGLHLTGS